MGIFDNTDGNTVIGGETNASGGEISPDDFDRHEAFAKSVLNFANAGLPDGQNDDNGLERARAMPSYTSQGVLNPEHQLQLGHAQKVWNFADAGERLAKAPLGQTGGTGYDFGQSGGSGAGSKDYSIGEHPGFQPYGTDTLGTGGQYKTGNYGLDPLETGGRRQADYYGMDAPGIGRQQVNGGYGMDTPSFGERQVPGRLATNALGGGRQSYPGQDWAEGVPGAYGAPEGVGVVYLKSGGGAGQKAQGDGLPAVTPEEEQRREQREIWLREKGIDKVWPGSGGLNSSFGKRIDPFTGEESDHRGIDIQNPRDGRVRASDSGTVVSTEPTKGGGNTVVVRHKDGSESIYMHTNPSVEVGQYVVAGATVGVTDTSGRSKGPHIHYGRRLTPGGAYVDPIPHLPKASK